MSFSRSFALILVILLTAFSRASTFASEGVKDSSNSKNDVLRCVDLTKRAVAHLEAVVEFSDSLSEFSNLPDVDGACLRALQQQPDDIRLQFGRAIVLVSENKNDKAIPHLRRAAESGSPHAKVILYLASRSDEGAYEALEEAAKYGSTPAMYLLGTYYFDRSSVLENHEKAESWYLKAANKGSAAAMYALGQGYFSGRLMYQDLNKAEHWLTEVFKKGHARAFRTLREIYYEDFAFLIGKDPSDMMKYMRRNVEWARLAIDREGSKAFFDLSLAYKRLINMHSLFVFLASRDETKARVPNYSYLEDTIPEAVGWLTTHAKSGDAFAQFVLGGFYATGEAVTKNLNEAVKWLCKARRSGYTAAKAKLQSVCSENNCDGLIPSDCY